MKPKRYILLYFTMTLSFVMISYGLHQSVLVKKSPQQHGIFSEMTNSLNQSLQGSRTPAALSFSYLQQEDNKSKTQNYLTCYQKYKEKNKLTFESCLKNFDIKTKEKNQIETEILFVKNRIFSHLFESELYEKLISQSKKTCSGIEIQNTIERQKCLQRHHDSMAYELINFFQIHNPQLSGYEYLYLVDGLKEQLNHPI
jgi:DNA polymerase III alpha subunit (gram-positive type)